MLYPMPMPMMLCIFLFKLNASCMLISKDTLLWPYAHICKPHINPEKWDGSGFFVWDWSPIFSSNCYIDIQVVRALLWLLTVDCTVYIYIYGYIAFYIRIYSLYCCFSGKGRFLFVECWNIYKQKQKIYRSSKSRIRNSLCIGVWSMVTLCSQTVGFLLIFISSNFCLF